MSKTGLLLKELHASETELAAACHAVAERHAADHGTYYPCHTLAAQCDAHAEQIRGWGGRYGAALHPPVHSDLLTAARDALRHEGSELLGRRTESGLLLLRDLRRLYVKAEATYINWIMLGQAARALRDQDLLTALGPLQQQTRTQATWITTRIKEAAPQILVATD
ncbi:hypothetical protein [Streptomyces sp. NRRL S-337]|uniref:hypothetical protein n=1 Tax=Streptomyces sp. NRRL S-337 TaxID=1463900 RepID=UPI0004CB9644|nr:hypothetical protein [Streptomyces sp. NRRL S-337]